MFLYYHIVSILIYTLFVAINVNDGKDIEIKEDENKTDEAMKRQIVNDIIRYSKAEAYAMIGTSVNTILHMKRQKTYNFNNHDVLRTELMKSDIKLLSTVRDIETKYIHCTYAHVANTMLGDFQNVFTQLSGAIEADKLSLLTSIGELVETSKILWRKAMNVVQSLPGIQVYPWLWQTLIYTNTISQVVRKTYPGISTATGVEILVGRVTSVQNTLRKWINDAANNCKQLPYENPWDLKLRHQDRTEYPSDIITADRKCPSKIDSGICRKHLSYVSLFDKMLYRNHIKNILMFDGYEKFDPEKWLLTSPVLEKMLVDGYKTNINWENVKSQLNLYVKRVSNEDWVLRYPNIYFDTVSNVINSVQQSTMQIIKQNWMVCKAYWRAIKFNIDNSPTLFNDYSTDCTDIKDSIGLIIEKMDLKNKKVFSTLQLLLRSKFTMDIEFNIAINYINEILNSQESHAIFKNDMFITDYTEHKFYEYRNAIQVYANDFPTFYEYNDVFQLFKLSYYENKPIPT